MSRILKEYVKLILKEESKTQNDNYTFGDLKKAIDSYIESKGNASKLKKNKKIGKQAARIAIDFIPFAGAAANTAELIGSLMNVEDDQRPEGFLGDFDLDDKTSKVVDNKVEAEFLKHITKVIDNKDENELIKDFDITSELNKFLEKEYNRKVVGHKK